jgi:dTDP-4-dehydrorhamnose 3,5-epimerase
MTIQKTELEGVYIIDNFVAKDERGTFVKTFNQQGFKDNKLEFEIRESYFSISQKDVIRGMHFQMPPYDHQKLVYVAQGSIIDVIVDLRVNSKTYKKSISVELSEENTKSVFIPKGFAHGFKSLEDNTITIYNVSSEYNSNFDAGLSYDSFGFDWKVESPIISSRDLMFESVNEFKSPF